MRPMTAPKASVRLTPDNHGNPSSYSWSRKAPHPLSTTRGREAYAARTIANTI